MPVVSRAGARSLLHAPINGGMESAGFLTVTPKAVATVLGDPAPIRHAPRQIVSIVRRQAGILMDVHSVGLYAPSSSAPAEPIEACALAQIEKLFARKSSSRELRQARCSFLQRFAFD
jgi:hypothetical protein